MMTKAGVSEDQLVLSKLMHVIPWAAVQAWKAFVIKNICHSAECHIARISGLCRYLRIICDEYTASPTRTTCRT
jgi:predicted transglutaminase-like protease